MGSMATEITSLTIVYSTVYPGSDQRKHQSSASLAFVRAEIVSIWWHHHGMNNPWAFNLTITRQSKTILCACVTDIMQCIVSHINTYSQKQNGRHFPNDIVKWDFLNENVWISLKISLKFALLRFELTIFQPWFWWWLGAEQATSHYLK